MEEKEIKLSNDLMEEIGSLRKELSDNIWNIGKINVDLHLMEREILSTRKELDGLYEASIILSKKENEMIKKLASLYGEGVLDYNKGIFIKN